MNLRERYHRARDQWLAGLLWSALMLGIHQHEPPPAWLNRLLDHAPAGVMVEFWDHCCAAAIADPAQEYADPRWTDFEGLYYVMWRRASGRTLPASEDWLFGWREMHSRPSP